MELTSLDYRNFDKHINKMYYYTMPDKNYYKTIFVKRNPFSNELMPLVSNQIFGVPPDGMEPISPLLLNRLMRVPNLSNNYF